MGTSTKDWSVYREKVFYILGQTTHAIEDLEKQVHALELNSEGQKREVQQSLRTLRERIDDVAGDLEEHIKETKEEKAHEVQKQNVNWQKIGIIAALILSLLTTLLSTWGKTWFGG